jgi:hypothetical protein
VDQVNVPDIMITKYVPQNVDDLSGHVLVKKNLHHAA